MFGKLFGKHKEAGGQIGPRPASNFGGGGGSNQNSGSRTVEAIQKLGEVDAASFITQLLGNKLHAVPLSTCTCWPSPYLTPTLSQAMLSFINLETSVMLKGALQACRLPPS